MRLPLTRRGWACLVGSVALAFGGRALGVIELFVLGAGAGALVVATAVFVLVRRRVQADATRDVVPGRVHAGADSRVELRVRNVGVRSTPVISLRDRVVRVSAPASGPSHAIGPLRQARFHVAPLGPGGSERAAYRLSTEQRGLYRVGPLDAVVSDPFGLASSSFTVAGTAELTVFPKVEVLDPPPLTTGNDARTGAGHPTQLGSGEEFYGLREYQVGDDLRRVHWPSTARRDELMIRQQELPWQGRATVLLDLRATTHTDKSLEQAVSAAASVVVACWGRDSDVRLVTTDGLDSGFGSGSAHLDAMMEHLAVVGAGSGQGLETMVRALQRRATGSLVIVTTESTSARTGLRGPNAVAGRTGANAVADPLTGLERLAGPGGRYGWVGLVLVAQSDGDPGGARSQAASGSLTVMRVNPGQPLADVWNPAVSTLRMATRAR